MRPAELPQSESGQKFLPSPPTDGPPPPANGLVLVQSRPGPRNRGPRPPAAVRSNHLPQPFASELSLRLAACCPSTTVSKNTRAEAWGRHITLCAYGHTYVRRLQPPSRRIASGHRSVLRPALGHSASPPVAPPPLCLCLRPGGPFAELVALALVAATAPAATNGHHRSLRQDEPRVNKILRETAAERHCVCVCVLGCCGSGGERKTEGGDKVYMAGCVGTQLARALGHTCTLIALIIRANAATYPSTTYSLHLMLQSCRSRRSAHHPEDSATGAVKPGMQARLRLRTTVTG